jgi:hypothetical protein
MSDSLSRKEFVALPTSDASADVLSSEDLLEAYKSLVLQLDQRTCEVEHLTLQLAESAQRTGPGTTHPMKDELHQRLCAVLYRLTALRQDAEEGRATSVLDGLIQVEQWVGDAIRDASCPPA